MSFNAENSNRIKNPSSQRPGYQSDHCLLAAAYGQDQQVNRMEVGVEMGQHVDLSPPCSIQVQTQRILIHRSQAPYHVALAIRTSNESQENTTVGAGAANGLIVVKSSRYGHL